MTEGLRSWILSAACCATVAAVLETLLPKGSGHRVGRLAAGMLMILVVVGPALRFEPESFFQGETDIAAAQKERSQTLEEQRKSLLEAIIAEECEAYILTWAEELGIQCRVSVRCDATEDGLPIPAGVTIRSSADEGFLAQLTEKIESELGISGTQVICREENRP